MNKRIGRFHVLTDLRFQQRFSHAELACLAAQGGADTIQFRQKSGSVRNMLAEAKRAASVCRERGVPFLVNDRLDVALACRADGIHLGQQDFPVREARRIMGPEAIIGGTATTVEEALAMQEAGADYAGFGPVFPTTSKDNPAPVKGVTNLAQVCKAVRIPVIAIAGISVERIGPVIRAGAHGVAVMTGVTTAENPARAARALREELDEVIVGYSD